MSRRVRARPIDPFRRMYISGDAGVVYDEEEEQGEGGMGGKKQMLVDLPVPEITMVENYEAEHAADFVQPLPFIKFPIRLEEFNDNEIEYDLDHDDEVRMARARATAFV